MGLNRHIEEKENQEGAAPEPLGLRYQGSEGWTWGGRNIREMSYIYLPAFPLKVH